MGRSLIEHLNRFLKLSVNSFSRFFAKARMVPASCRLDKQYYAEGPYQTRTRYRQTFPHSIHDYPASWLMNSMMVHSDYQGRNNHAMQHCLK
jgi:predicted YcjX-like family ATPase